MSVGGFVFFKLCVFIAIKVPGKNQVITSFIVVHQNKNKLVTGLNYLIYHINNVQ